MLSRFENALSECETKWHSSLGLLQSLDKRMFVLESKLRPLEDVMSTMSLKFQNMDGAVSALEDILRKFDQVGSLQRSVESLTLSSHLASDPSGGKSDAPIDIHSCLALMDEVDEVLQFFEENAHFLSASREHDALDSLREVLIDHLMNEFNQSTRQICQLFDPGKHVLGISSSQNPSEGSARSHSFSGLASLQSGTGSMRSVSGSGLATASSSTTRMLSSGWAPDEQIRKLRLIAFRFEKARVFDHISTFAEMRQKNLRESMSRWKFTGISRRTLSNVMTEQNDASEAVHTEDGENTDRNTSLHSVSGIFRRHGVGNLSRPLRSRDLHRIEGSVGIDDSDDEDGDRETRKNVSFSIQHDDAPSIAAELSLGSRSHAASNSNTHRSTSSSHHRVSSKYQPGSHRALRYITTCLQMFDAEEEIISAIFDEESSPFVFKKIMEPVWSSLVSNLTPVIGDQSMKDRLFVLLDLYEHLCDEEDVILRLLGNGKEESKMTVSKLYTMCCQCCLDLLSEIVERVRSLQDPLPSDCTVQEISTSILQFMLRLLEYQFPMEHILSLNHGENNGQTALELRRGVRVPDSLRYVENLAQYFEYLLGSLLDSLATSVSLYASPSRPPHKCVVKAEHAAVLFILNNLDFITQELAKYSNLRSALSLEYFIFLEDRVNSLKDQFEEKICEPLLVPMRVSPDIPTNSSQSLTNDARKRLKSAFSTFNELLEETIRSLGAVVVPNPDLRRELQERARTTIVESYEDFYLTYSVVPFTRAHPEKYLKFNLALVEEVISFLFEPGKSHLSFQALQTSSGKK